MRAAQRILTGVFMVVLLTTVFAACTPNQMRAWFDTQGIEHSSMSADDIEWYAQAATDYWTAVAITTTTTAPPPPVYQPHCVIPAYICKRESGFSYTALNRSSMAGGMYQFLPSTWNGVARQIAPQWVGTYPHQAPPAVQDQFAAWLWAGGRGCSHWNACRG